ncbi:hypothetical protein FOZ62_019524, partial [Perkinsus olseni]
LNQMQCMMPSARTWDRAEKSDFSTLVKEFFSTSPRSCWGTTPQSRSEHSRMIDYLYFRTEFFAPITSTRVVARRREGFDFLIYMEHCLAESCTEQMQLHPGTLVFLGLISIPMHLLSKMRGIKGILLMCALPWTLLLLVVLIKRNLSRVVDSLRPTHEEMLEAVSKDPRMGPTSIEHLHTKAPYSSEGNHFKPNGWLMSFLRGTTVPTMHENVFLLQKNGPAFTAKALQVVCFATALYSGCLFFRLLDFTTKRWRRYWFLLPAGAFPILIIIFDILPSALERLVISTSVCQMKRMHVIMEVKKMLEAHRCELCLNLLRNVKLLSMHYLLTEAPEAQRASLAAAGIVGQAASVFLSWMETFKTSHSGELEFREFCVIMIALRVAVNNVISEDEFCAAIRRALPLRDTAGADEVLLSPEDVRNILEEFKVVHPRSHVVARHMTNFTSANQLLEVEERSGHDVHSPLTEALMLVTAIENANIYVRKDELPKRGNLQVSLLEFVRYFIKLDIYQTHDPQNSSPEPFDHMASLEFKSERPWMPL